MLDMVLARKQAKLHGACGSRSVSLPKDWIRELGVNEDEEVELVRTVDHIEVFPVHRGAASIEDEPEFARFLDFLAQSALSYPEQLGDVADLVSEDGAMVEGVPAEV